MNIGEKNLKIERDELHSMIEKAGFSCGKNTAMVDVFDRFSQLIIEKMKEELCKPQPTPKPSVKIEKASSSSAPPSSSGPSSSLPMASPPTKQITIE